MIEFKNVSKQFNNNSVIKDLNFKIDCGEFFVIIGASGSGKTTILKMINQLIVQTSGDIFINGKSVKDYNLRQLRLNIGYVLQQIALFPNLSVYENVCLIPKMKKFACSVTKKRIDEFMQLMGLDPEIYKHRKPNSLSGGEAQRVGILRAIIGNPSIILMDEPFSALDPIARKQLQKIIKTIHETLDITVVFVTHDMQEALSLGERICIVNNGEIVQIGTPKEIKDHPNNLYVKELIESGCDN
ncbi:MAG: ABC transporter ATP-binding protein [Erysipelotrichaceae bacterium]|nr:ABC transporter ATP-binding protein [Erysipelotrichaceae bacterium]